MRASQFYRGGGGFLNGVDATFTGYTFTAPTTYTSTKGETKGKDFTPVNFIPTFRVDGADTDVEKRMRIGNLENYEGISDDGRTLQLGTFRLGFKTEAGIFLESLFKPSGGGDGFPDDLLSDDITILNLEPVIGTRMRLKTIDALDRNGKVKTHTGKNKEGEDTLFTDKNVIVETVYDLPTAAHKANGSAAKVGKAAKAAKVADVAQEAAEALQGVLEAKGGTIARAKLAMAVRMALREAPNREAIVAYLSKDENLDNIGDVEYDETSISAA